MKRITTTLLLGLLLCAAGRGEVAAARDAAPRPRREFQSIVLDPGHGGDERGAIGPSGLDEKSVTLDLCRRIKSALEKEQGLDVVLTRDRDQLVGLWERPAIANRLGADLFVSVHANGSPAPGATGVETYFMSVDAPDEEARRLAAIENDVVSAKQAPIEVQDDLNDILWAMAQEAFLVESQNLAELIQDHLNRELQVPDRGIKQAPFVVLRNATMPAVLVEVGFISNPEIEKRLADPAYLDAVARAIARGISTFRAIYEK